MQGTIKDQSATTSAVFGSDFGESAGELSRKFKIDLRSITSFLGSVSIAFHKVGSIILFSVITALVGMDVTLRYFFNSPTTWADEVLCYLLLAAMSLSLVRCWDEGKHIRMGLLYEQFSGRLRACSDVLTSLLGIGFFAMMGYQAAVDIPFMIKTHEVGDLSSMPLWPFRAILVIVAILFCSRLIVLLVISLRRMVKRGEVK